MALPIMLPTCEIITADCISGMSAVFSGNVQCCVTSPPYYGLRDYGTDAQIGAESSPELYIEHIVEMARQVRRVLREDGVFWLNLGDSYYNYRPGLGQRLSKQSLSKTLQDLPSTCARRGTKLAGFKEKDRMMIPARCALALWEDGWYLRDEIVWFKRNPMPESVTDRTTKAHEFIYMLTKSKDYYYDQEAILEPAAYDGRIDTMMKGSRKYCDGELIGQSPNTLSKKGGERWPKKLAYNQKHDSYGPNGQAFNSIHAMEGGIPARNKRSVWDVTTVNCPDEHFAPFPPDLIKPCILAGSRIGDTILDPCAGRGTTGMVANELGRNAILIEINPKYAEMCRRNISDTTPGLPL